MKAGVMLGMILSLLVQGDISEPATEGAVFDPEFFRFLAQLGVGGAIAGIVFFFYRKDVRSYTDLWAAQTARSDRMTEAMMALVAQNSTNTATNTEVLKSLHHRIDKLDLLRVVEEERRPLG